MANKTIGDLTAGTMPDGTEIFHGVQGGNSRRFTADQLRGHAPGGVASLAQGDLLYVGPSGVITRLPKGSAGQSLVQNAALTAPEWAPGVTLGSVVSSAGTFIDFTGIPAWARRITLNFVGMSHASGSTQKPIIRIGDSGGIETTGYLGTALDVLGGTGENVTSGFQLGEGISAVSAFHGSVVIELQNPATNTWCAQGSVALSTSPQVALCAGSKSLSGILDTVRFTTVGGAATLDAGSVNISYQ